MVGFGDNAGSGFPFILATWANENWKMPELYEDIVLNQVTLNLSMVTDSQKKNIKEPKKGADKGAKKEPKKRAKIVKENILEQRKTDILELLRIDGTITQTDIMNELNISRKQVQITIKALCDEGRLTRHGSNRNGIWIVVE